MKLISMWHYRRLVSKLLVQQEKYAFGSGTYYARCFATESTKVDELPSTVEQTGVEDGQPVKRERRKVECPENAKLMKISIIGLPNAGKSTIINALTKYDVCPVSRRPHTTRKNQKAVFLDDNTQLVFVDTPGLVSVKEIKKFSFMEEFVYGPEKSIASSHVVAVIHDVSSTITREKLDFRIKRVLEKFPDKKSILILNKIDQVPKKFTLLEAVKYLTGGVVAGKPLPVRTFEEKKQSHRRLNTEEILAKAKQRYELKEEVNQCLSEEEERDLLASKFFTKDEIKKGIHKLGWPNFHDVFMVSALEGDGIELLRRYLIMNAVPHDWLYESDTLTDVPPEKLFLSILRSKMLEHLPQELPFQVKPVIELWEESESGILCITCKIKCMKEKHQWRILGTGGNLINKVINDTETALSALLYRPVKLTLNPVFDKQMAKNEK